MNPVLVFVVACTCMRASQAGLPEVWHLVTLMPLSHERCPMPWGQSDLPLPQVAPAVAGRKLLQDSCICTDVVPGVSCDFLWLLGGCSTWTGLGHMEAVVLC